MISLVVAMIAFLAGHFVLSHPLRARLVRAWGLKPFLTVYSLLAIVTLTWVAIAYHSAPQQPLLWDSYAVAPWIGASVLTYLALVLFLASLGGNPALPGARVAGLSAIWPKGVFQITRHPMMMGIALASVAHFLVTPSPRGAVLNGGITLLALGGAHLQDRKKDALHGRDWRAWMKRTPFWPRLQHMHRLRRYWALAVLPWLAFTWLHNPLAHLPAGIWRWVDAANW